jgi:diaminopimelate epimerase
MGLSSRSELVVETASGIIVLFLEGDGVRVNMGTPKFEPSCLPLTLLPASRYEVALSTDEVVYFGAVSMGNPHAVLLVDDTATAEVDRLGTALQARRDIFPQSVNAGFAQVVSSDHIRLRVYERGAGETLACGTGACAAMAVCRAWGLVSDQVRVSLPGGDLLIRWSGQQDDVLWMTGPAVSVFDGIIEVPDV